MEIQLAGVSIPAFALYCFDAVWDRVMTRRRIDVAERRARLQLRQALAPAARVATPLDAARSVVALHGTDPAAVHLAVWARTRRPDSRAMERALYEERTMVRMLGMRRTMFVVPLDLAPVVQAACTRAIALQQRRLLIRHLEAASVAGDAGRWLRQVEQSTLRALAARGAATAIELSRDEPRLRRQITLAAGKSYGGPANISTRVLFLLAADGRIMRGRPRGSWISSQYRWTPTDSWLKGGLPAIPVESARVELVRRWLRCFGPGTAADVRWWTGWTMGEVRRALGDLRAVEVDLDGAAGYLLPDDLAPVRPPKPGIALLPALDSTVMGWAERDWYLGPHRAALFDRSGNPGPTIWWDGRVIGGWAQRPESEIVYRVLEDVGREVAAGVEAEADRLRDFMGPVRVTPRFRTPLERQLSG